MELTKVDVNTLEIELEELEERIAPGSGAWNPIDEPIKPED